MDAFRIHRSEIQVRLWYGEWRRINGVPNDYGSIMHYDQDVSMSWAAGSCDIGPSITTAIWRRRKTFEQWQCSLHRKLCCHWLKGLRQRQFAVVLQGPVLYQNRSWHIIDTYRPHQNGCIINIIIFRLAWMFYGAIWSVTPVTVGMTGVVLHWEPLIHVDRIASSLYLLLPWRQIGARASATNLLWLWCIEIILRN